jgi:hypothetical protein
MAAGAGIACSMMIAEVVYDVKARVILDSCVRAVTAWDIITSMIKAWVFGIIIAVVRALRLSTHPSCQRVSSRHQHMHADVTGVFPTLMCCMSEKTSGGLQHFGLLCRGW